MTTTPDKIEMLECMLVNALKGNITIEGSAMSFFGCGAELTTKMKGTPDYSLRLSNLLQDPEWLAANGLLVKPEKCDKCGDSGDGPDHDCETCCLDDSCTGSCLFPVPCPCRKNPNSLYNFINGE